MIPSSGPARRRTRVKICGLTRPHDAEVAARLGADAIGVVFAESRRQVDLERAREVLEAAGPFVTRVGVFAGQDTRFIANAVARCRLDWIQLPLEEAPDLPEDLPARVMRTVSMTGPGALADASSHAADAWLLDTPPGEGPRGGTGRVFDWSLASEFTWPRGSVVLAGGLNAANVGEAIRRVHPGGVDVSSSVESAPGVKDPARMEAFLQAVAQADASMFRADREAPEPELMSTGRFGPWGGRYVPETLVPALDDLAEAFGRLWSDEGFHIELDRLLADYVGRPTPLYRAQRLGEEAGGATIYLKREDLAHTGSHKLNNALAQALMARSLGRQRLIAETGAGQHGVATATAAALVGLPCEVYMGTTDMERQRLNVDRMELLGARVIPVESGSRTLKDATSQAIRDWMGSHEHTHYVIGSVVGPHPYPLMVRTFQSVIGREARAQVLRAEGRLPDGLIACVGGGSNAIGLFHAFTDDGVPMVGVEAAGEGIGGGRHAASISGGSPGVLHGSYSHILQDADGQVAATHSVAAGLDYPGVGPEHLWLRDRHLARYVTVTDSEAQEAHLLLARCEGIIPALESSHALAWAVRWGRELGRGAVLLVNLSGRGDKDVASMAAGWDEDVH